MSQTSRTTSCGFGRYGQKSCFTADEQTCVIKAYNKLFGTHYTSDEIEQDLHLNWYDYLREPDFYQTTKQLCPKLVFQIFRLAFKPQLDDSDGTGWLANTDLDMLFNQIVASPVGDNFIYLGTLSRNQPIKMPPESRSKSWGAIINTDNSREPGQHWVAVYSQFTNNPSDRVVEYFDSNGDSPVRRDPHRDMVTSIKRFGDYPIIYNSIRHQLDNKSCGVHSAAFILQRVAGLTFQEIVAEQRQDKVMQQLKRQWWAVSG